MRRMRATVEENNIYDWASKMLTHLARLADQTPSETEITRLNLAAV